MTDEELIDELVKHKQEMQNDFGWNTTLQTALDTAIIALKAQPEIVRCKDCKYRDAETSFCEGRGWPMQLVPNNGFCDKGKRSEE